MLSGHFIDYSVPCQAWSIASTASALVAACVYDQSEIAPNRLAYNYSGYHYELKMVLRGTAECELLINSTGLSPPPCTRDVCPQTTTVDQTKLTIYEVTALHWLYWLLA